MAALHNVSTEYRHWNLAEWLRFQERLHPRSIELGLERVRIVAQRLQLLERPPLTLTIGGTNGKGSSATLAALICREAGHRVGLYTSPHLLRYNERVQVDGSVAEDAELCAAFAEIEHARGDIALTYFEFGTLAALLLFRQRNVNVQVLEVGLGGRLDAVNMVDADAALVTNVGLDHMDWLGNDRDSIGREKAGIFRAGRPSISADPDPPPPLRSAQWQLGRDFGFAEDGSRWRWFGPGVELKQLPRPGLPGRFQLQNAAGVLALLHSQPQLNISASHITSALPRLSLPGRFQCAGRLILDVAHNAEAAETLVQNVQESGLGRDLKLVLGMLSDKPVAAVGRILSRVCSEAHLGGLPGPRSLSSADLARRLEGCGMRLRQYPDIRTACAAAAAETSGHILVTGSFLTVAEIAGTL